MRKITDYDGTVLPVDTVNLYGAIKDDPGGTQINSKSNSDMQAFFERAADLAGIVPNSLPDNATNGFQMADAVLGKWQNGPALALSAPAGGGISGGSLAYNRYTIVGKTLHWQVEILNCTITGSCPTILAQSPSSANFPNNVKFIGQYNDTATLVVTTSALTALGQVSLTVAGGGNFTAGSANQSFSFNIVAELP